MVDLFLSFVRTWIVAAVILAVALSGCRARDTAGVQINPQTTVEVGDIEVSPDVDMSMETDIEMSPELDMPVTVGGGGDSIALWIAILGIIFAYPIQRTARLAIWPQKKVGNGGS